MRPAGSPEESPLTIGKDPFHPAATADPPLPLPESIRKPLEEAKLSVAAAAEARVGQPRQPGDDVQIVTLGTGSAVPSRYRGGELIMSLRGSWTDDWPSDTQFREPSSASHIQEAFSLMQEREHGDRCVGLLALIHRSRTMSGKCSAT
jgi:hypothetical protein